jgi:hypothetical protein
MAQLASVSYLLTHSQLNKKLSSLKRSAPMALPAGRFQPRSETRAETRHGCTQEEGDSRG